MLERHVWRQVLVELEVVLLEAEAVHESLCRSSAKHVRLHAHNAMDPDVHQIHASTCEVPNHREQDALPSREWARLQYSQESALTSLPLSNQSKVADSRQTVSRHPCTRVAARTVSSHR